MSLRTSEHEKTKQKTDEYEDKQLIKQGRTGVITSMNTCYEK